MLGEIYGAQLQHNVVTYSATISACTEGQRWQTALGSLDEMRDVQPAQLVSCSTTCHLQCHDERLHRDRRWQKALRIAGPEPRRPAPAGQRWQNARELLDEVCASNCSPTRPSTTPQSALVNRASGGRRPWNCWMKCVRPAAARRDRLQRQNQRLCAGPAVAEGPGIAG